MDPKDRWQQGRDSMADSGHALVRRVQNGDTDAFTELVTGHHKSVYGIALSVTGDTDEAEDMTQSCFVDAFARIGELRDGRRFSSWLYAIARNRCRDWLRDRRRRPVLLSDPEQLGVAGSASPRGTRGCCAQRPTGRCRGVPSGSRHRGPGRQRCLEPRGTSGAAPRSCGPARCGPRMWAGR